MERMSADQDRMTTMNISLPEALRRFVETRATERYGSVSEYIRELVREDERRASAEHAEATLIKSLDSSRVDRTAVKDAIDGIRRLREQVAARGVSMSKAEIVGSIRRGRR
jgi:antitoxin ParD1/3/4